MRARSGVVDLSALADTLPEPGVTAHLKRLLEETQKSLTPWQAQAAAIRRHGSLEPRTLATIRHGWADAKALYAAAEELAHRRGDDFPSNAMQTLEAVQPILARAHRKPAVTSAVVWCAIGEAHERFAQHVVELIRELAQLPSLRRPLETERFSRDTTAVRELVVALAERQAEDASTWLEEIPAPFGPESGATLFAQSTRIEELRSEAKRLTTPDFMTFAQRAATFLVQISTRRLDPLGFPLAREVELVHDPKLDHREQIVAWARRAGHRLSLRGRMLVLQIAVESPWPLRLELIAADIGSGQSGATALLLRLAGEAGPWPPTSARAPVLLLFAGESPEERGRRFEGWLPDAYARACADWRPWS
jgi:hypothetical protein